MRSCRVFRVGFKVVRVGLQLDGKLLVPERFYIGDEEIGVVDCSFLIPLVRHCPLRLYSWRSCRVVLGAVGLFESLPSGARCGAWYLSHPVCSFVMVSSTLMRDRFRVASFSREPERNGFMLGFKPINYKLYSHTSMFTSEVDLVGIQVN